MLDKECQMQNADYDRDMLNFIQQDCDCVLKNNS